MLGGECRPPLVYLHCRELRHGPRVGGHRHQTSVLGVRGAVARECTELLHPARKGARRESTAVSTETSRSRSDEILDVAEARSAQHRSSDAIWDAVVECQGAPSPRLAEADAALKAMSLNDSGRESCRDSSAL